VQEIRGLPQPRYHADVNPKPVLHSCQKGNEPLRNSETAPRAVDRGCGRVDSLGAAVFSSYLFKIVTSGEIGSRSRRRRSNRPGNSQANGPRDLL